MHNYRIVIVEDNKYDAGRLSEYIEKYFSDEGKTYTLTVYNNVVDFLEKKIAVDIIFMDIELPLMTGMEASHRIREYDKNVLIIFVTNLAQYALEGYAVNAFDFVVKPISYYDFAIKMKRAAGLIERDGGVKVEAKTKNGVFYIPASDIRYVEVVDHALTYHTADDTVVSSGKLYEVENILCASGFFKCNRCYLVNMRYVKSINDGVCEMVNGDKLLISRNRKKEFSEALADFLCGGV